LLIKGGTQGVTVLNFVQRYAKAAVQEYKLGIVYQQNLLRPVVLVVVHKGP
jgi:hypothetical protein